MKRAMRLALAVFLAGTLAGCSSITGFFSSKRDPKSLPAELTAIAQPATTPKLEWQQGLGSSGSHVFTPAVVGDSVYAASEEGSVARYDNGKQVWRSSAAPSLSGGVGSDGHLVVVGTAKGEVIALDAANGKPVWRARVSSEVLAAPAIGQEVVVVRSGDSQITALEAADGKRRWVYQRSMPTLNLRSEVGVTLAPGGVLAGFPGGKLAAIAINNGGEIWEATVAQPKGSTELERVADVTSLPVISGREVCAAAFQGRVACFDVASGNPIWSRDFSSVLGLDIDSRAVYVSGENGTMMAFDKNSGVSLWKHEKLANRMPSRPLVLGRLAVVGDFQGYLHLLRLEDGTIVGRVATDGSAVTAAPQTTTRGFLAQTRNGGLYSYSLE